MNIINAPFIGVAVPEMQAEISQAYWCTPVAVKQLAKLYGLSSGKAVTKAAGRARLSGVTCRECRSEFTAKTRGEALHILSQFQSGKRNRAQCDPCWQVERDRRMKRRWEGRREDNRAYALKAKGSEANVPSVPSSTKKDDFYKSWEWRTLRMQAIQKHGQACQCCGARPGDKDVSGKPVRIVVDHIKPISKHWNLRLDLSNLQILCDECNMGKGNWDETDFRPEPPRPMTDEDHRLALVMAQLGEEGTLQ